MSEHSTPAALTYKMGRCFSTLLTDLVVSDTHYAQKKTDICIAPHSKKLTAEALKCGSHSFHTANTPHLPLPITFHQRAPPV